MSQNNSQGKSYKEVVYEAILDLHVIDEIPWDVLTRMAGYKGSASLKNIVQQGSHGLEFSRGLQIMKGVSSEYANFRLHKHAFDTNSKMIVNRPKLDRATGDMTKEFLSAMQALSDGLKAHRMNDHRGMDEAYLKLLVFLGRLRAEIDCARSVLAKKEGAA